MVGLLFQQDEGGRMLSCKRKKAGLLFGADYRPMPRYLSLLVPGVFFDFANNGKKKVFTSGSSGLIFDFSNPQ